MKKGDIVKPVHCERSQYMNAEFRKWIDDNADKTFYVKSEEGNRVKLAKVSFYVTKEFLEKV